MTQAMPRRAPGALVLPLLVLAALAALLLVRAAPARASDTMSSIMMDDDQLLYRDNHTRDVALRQMAALGVDAVRVTVLWSVVADGAKDTRARAKRFKPGEPSTYPHRNWDRYDELVRNATSDGIQVYFNVTGPGPEWTHKHTGHRSVRDTWEPSARAFYSFVAAVGKRFSGRYADENGCHCTLPAVHIWSLWNEPNQGGWLAPQYKGSLPYSPILYRRLWFYGRKALTDTGHDKDAIFVGETAPLGSSRHGISKPMDPKTFIREFFCLDRHYEPYRGKSAQRRECSYFAKFGPVKATAWAHHPYTKKDAPTRKSHSRGAITMANLDDLTNLLDGVQFKTGYLPPPPIAAKLPVVLSEFGYETKPPDKYAGISQARQAEYLNLGQFVAFNNPRVIGQTQFLLRDVPPLRDHKRGSKAYWHTYQSGLYTARGRAKPAAGAYALPFFAYRTGPGAYHVWGQLKFRPNGIADSVAVQFQPPGATAWTTISNVAVQNPKGFFQTDVGGLGAGRLRLFWQGGEVPYQFFSREIRVKP